MEPMRIPVFMEEQDLSRLTECKGYVAEAEGSQMSVVGGVQ